MSKKVTFKNLELDYSSGRDVTLEAIQKEVKTVTLVVDDEVKEELNHVVEELEEELEQAEEELDNVEAEEVVDEEVTAEEFTE